MRLRRVLLLLVLCLSSRLAAQTPRTRGRAGRRRRRHRWCSRWRSTGGTSSTPRSGAGTPASPTRCTCRPDRRSSSASCSSTRASRTTRPSWPSRSGISGRSGVFRRVQIDSVRTDSGLTMRVVTKDGWSTRADWRFRSVGRGRRVHHRPDRGQPPRHRHPRRRPLPQDHGPHQRRAGLPPAAPLRRPRGTRGRIRESLRRRGRGAGGRAAVLLPHVALRLPGGSGGSRRADSPLLRRQDEAGDSLSRRYSLGAGGVGLGAPRLI